MMNARGMFPVLPMLAVLLAVLVPDGLGQMVQSSCPMNCFCEDTLVECMSLMEFPMNLPSDTKTFKTSQMNVRDLPPDAFSYLPDLEVIEFNNCNIQNVQGCSFKDLPSIKEIRLIKTVIESIESYAFSGLSDVLSIELNSCRVGRIKPFAFYGLRDVHMFTLYNTHIQNFYNHAMYNVTMVDRMIVTRSNLSDIVTGAFNHMTNVTNLEMHLNSFWNMQCLVLEDLMASTRNFIFLQNTFYCNCSVFYMVNSVGRVKYPNVIEKNRCHGPEEFVNKSTLWHVAPSTLMCPGLRNDREAECTRTMLRPNPKCPVLQDGVFTSITDSPDPDNGGSWARDLTYDLGLILAGMVAWRFL